MKARIVELYARDIDTDDYCHTIYQAMDATKWEEVTQEDINCLRQWVMHKNKSYSNIRYLLVLDTDIPLGKCIKEYKEIAIAEEKEIEERRAKAEAKKAKRLATLARKREEKERALLTDLSQKYGG